MQAGTRLGPYEIVSPLGAGGMGEVYRARDTRLERDVALKLLPAAAAGDELARARLLREARLASKLNHPNVCTIHEVGEADGQIFVAMELVGGETLAERLSLHAMSPEGVLQCGQQLADALAHAHEHGVVHRDFKSANVILTPEGRVKVLDFGLAKKVSLKQAEDATTLSRATLTEAGTIAGTPAYMAPEQFRGLPADERSDVWALGVVLYEMAAGRRPFQGNTGFELISEILGQPHRPLPASVPGELKGVIERCLAKEPGARYQRGSEVRVALETVQSGRAVGPWPGLKVSLGRRKWLLVATLLAAAIALLFGLNGFDLRSRLFGSRAIAGIDSLAVLPLENLSGDAEQGYLADGIHDALITNLSQLSGLKRVIARSSVLRFKGTTVALRTVAEELKVAGLITGAVLRSGDRVRVTAQLINPKTEAQVWASSYERPLKDILSLENEIVSAITREVRLRLTPEEKTRLSRARPVNPETYEAYLKGKFFLNKRTPEGFAKGLELLQQAIEKDPSEPLPYAGLALGIAIVAHGNGSIVPVVDFPRAREAALKALELDDNLAEAHLSLAAVKLYFDYDWPGAERKFRRALELDPNLADAHLHYAAYAALFGRKEECLAGLKRAVELEPLSAFHVANWGWFLWGFGQTERGLEEARKALDLDPDLPDALYVLGGALGDKKLFDEALAAHRKLAAINPDWRWALAETYAKMGRKTDALVILADLERENYPKHAIFIAGVQMALEDKEETFRALEAAYRFRHIFLPFTVNPPEQFPWRDDPRFTELRRRMNFPKG
jgi:serine/threonine protein kinase